jgi:hypothetical protein
MKTIQELVPLIQEWAKELDNRNEEVAINWSMYLFKG